MKQIEHKDSVPVLLLMIVLYFLMEYCRREYVLSGCKNLYREMKLLKNNLKAFIKMNWLQENIVSQLHCRLTAY